MQYRQGAGGEPHRWQDGWRFVGGHGERVGRAVIGLVDVCMGTHEAFDDVHVGMRDGDEMQGAAVEVVSARFDICAVMRTRRSSTMSY